MSTAAERAHASLQTRIVTGELAPGALLSENQLSAELGMSRTPIRAALARLQDDGWVQILPQRGARVLPLSDEQVEQLTSAFAALEAAAVREATAAELIAAAEDIREGLQVQERALAHRDAAALVAAAEAFHTRIVAAAGNDYLDRFAAQLTLKRQRLLHAQGQRLFERGAQLIQEHESLAAFLERGDREGYVSLLRAHLHATHRSSEAAAARRDADA